MAKIHERMPVILPDGGLEAYEVSALVNSQRDDSPEFMRTVK